MAAAGDEGGRGTPVTVRDLPSEVRFLVDRDEEADHAHVARGEWLTATVCDHDLRGDRAQHARGSTLARWGERPVCQDCVRILRRDG